MPRAKRVVKLYKMAEIQIIDPTVYPNWDSLLETSTETTFFHTAAWAKVLNESYGYKPLYFTIIENGKLVGFIPVMEIDSILTGKRGVSLPFTDVCDPVTRDSDVFARLFEAVIAHGREAGWKNLEIRGGNAILDKEPPAAQLVVHTLALNPEAAEVSKAFRDSTYRNILKAQKEGVTVNLEHSSAAMVAFYRLHCETRRHQGLPPQPWPFFENIFELVIAGDKGFVAVAEHLGKIIAAAVFFHFRSEAIFKFGASDRNHLGHRPNNLIMWEAIKKYSQKGFKVLDFGRTELENIGLRQFKNGWDSDEKKLFYYQYDLKKDRFVSTSTRVKSSYAAFKHLPIPILRLTGHLLYRHVG